MSGLEKGRLQGNLTAASRIYGEIIKKTKPESAAVHGVRMRDNGHKLKGERWLDIRNNFSL